MITVYIFYNLVYALFSFPVGMLADKIGLKTIFITGLIVFSIVYTGFAFANQTILFYLLFFLYGIYASATEGISKAWITNISHKGDTATAIGTYSAFQSLCTLLASSIAGFVWFQFGALVTFLLTALITVGVAGYMLFIPTAKMRLTSEK